LGVSQEHRAVESPVLRLVPFTVEGQRYGLSLEAVERVFPMVAISPLPKAPAVALGVINIHGEVIAVVDIRLRFGLPARQYGPAEYLLVARTSRRKIAIPVEEVLGMEDVPAESVTSSDSLLPGIGYVAGIVKLHDGLLFIHDLETFLSLDEEQRLSESIEGVRG